MINIYCAMEFQIRTPPGARRGRNGDQDAGGGGSRRVARVRQDVGRPESPAATPDGAYKAQEVPGRAPRTCSKGPKRCLLRSRLSVLVCSEL